MQRPATGGLYQEEPGPDVCEDYGHSLKRKIIVAVSIDLDIVNGKILRGFVVKWSLAKAE